MASNEPSLTKPVPWAMAADPEGGHTSQILVLANSRLPRLVRVCYGVGPDGSFIQAQANTNGGKVVTTRIYKGGCADLGGTTVELMNPNASAASGTYEIVAADPPADPHPNPK